MRASCEIVTGFGATPFPVLLLAWGAANGPGTVLAASLLKTDLMRTWPVSPLVLSLCAGSVLRFGVQPWVTASTTVAWGLALSVVPVGCPTWVTWVLGNEAECAGGLQVAVLQLAAGAGPGGVAFEVGGSPASPAMACVLLFFAAVAVGCRLEGQRRKVDSSAAARSVCSAPGDIHTSRHPCRRDVGCR